MSRLSAPARRYVTEQGTPIHGVLAQYGTPQEVYAAAEKVRDAGYTQWDVHAPFPIHGIDEAMGVKRTRLPALVAFGGLTGAGLGYLMQWWMSGVDYPLVTQGKPYVAWEQFVPITFELGILIASFTTLIGMLALNGLPRWNHPLFNSERFLSSSDDGFFIAIESTDPKFDPDQTRRLLSQSGASVIELVEDPD
jgi:hypothetical protein